jgi:hypothetical protein
MNKIELEIECQSCGGTGVYSGMGEGKGAGVVCYVCEGTGAYDYVFEYSDFHGKNRKDGIDRVYKRNMGYMLSTGAINFKGVGEIDMDKEGVSYDDFFDGKMPEHIKQLGCPMRADQGECHDIEGFVDECNNMGLEFGGIITDCKNYPKKHECWTRFGWGKARKNVWAI